MILETHCQTQDLILCGVDNEFGYLGLFNSLIMVVNSGPDGQVLRKNGDQDKYWGPLTQILNFTAGVGWIDRDLVGHNYAIDLESERYMNEWLYTSETNAALRAIEGIGCLRFGNCFTNLGYDYDIRKILDMVYDKYGAGEALAYM